MAPIMTNEDNQSKKRPRILRATALALAFGFVASTLPTTAAQASSPSDASGDAINSPAQSAPASLISAMVPFLPMEPGGIAFARIFTLNLGSSPTATASTTSLDIAGLPAGVSIVGADPQPADDKPGWKCEIARCSWVDATGAGVQIPMGQTVEGMLKLKIDATAQLPVLSDADVAEMADINSDTDAARENAMNAIAAKLARVNVSTAVDGDAGVTSQQTQSYLAITDKPGRARVVPVLSVPTGLEPGDAATFTLSALNIGGVATTEPINITKPVPANVGVAGLTIDGAAWSCAAGERSVDSCTYSETIEPGQKTGAVKISGTVRDDAATGESTKWIVVADGAPAGVPTDASFTINEPQSPDLGVQLTSSTPVVVAGGTVDLSVQIATYGGKTRTTSTLEITGVPGASIDNVDNSRYGDNVPVEQEAVEKPIPAEIAGQVTTKPRATSTSNGEDVVSPATETPDVSNCVAIEDGIRCDVRPVEKAEVIVSNLTLRLPKEIAGDKENRDAISVTATIEADGERDSTNSNNSASTPVIVQPANVPYPGLFPVRLDAEGKYEKFSGDSVFVPAGKSEARSFAIVNTGAVEFPAGTTFRVNVAAGRGFDVSTEGWDCKSTDLPAPVFTEERRTQATIAASSRSLFFDANQTASPIEKQLLEQVKAQTTKTPIAQVEGDVPGLDCTLMLDAPLSADGVSTPLTLNASTKIDADTTVQIWRISLVQPELDESISTDFTVMSKARRHVVRPSLMTGPVRAGADASVSVGISNKGEDVAAHPAVLVAMPSRTMITANRSVPKGWKCIQIAPGLASGLVVCSGSKLEPGASSDAAIFDFRAFGDRDEASKISAVALTNGSKVGLTSATTAEIGVKAPIKIQVTGPDSVNDVSIPLSGGEPTNTTVYLSAQSSTEGLRYEWKQLCTTAGEENCSSIAPSVKFTKAFGPNAEVSMPRVVAATDIVVQVTGYDGNAKATATRTIRLEPKPTIQAPPKADPNGPSGFGAPGQSLQARLFRSATTTEAPTTIASADEESSDETVETETPALDPKRSTGGGSVAALTHVTRALGGVSVRANVLGGNVIAAEPGGSARALASAAIGSTVTWSWRVVGGSSPIARNQSFVDAVAALTSASFKITLPLGANDVVVGATPTTIAASGSKLRSPNVRKSSAPGETTTSLVEAADPKVVGESTTTQPEQTTTTGLEATTTTTANEISDASEGETTSAGGVIVVAVTATNSAGASYEDILIIHVGTDVPKTIEKLVVFDGVDSYNQLVLGVGGSATIGAAVPAGYSIEWNASSGAISLTDESSEGVTVGASSRLGATSITALIKNAAGAVVDATVIPVVTNSVPAVDDFCEEITSGVKSLIESVPGMDLDAELSQAGSDCADLPVVAFENQAVDLGVVRIAGASGRVSRDGIWLRSGSVETTLALPVKSLEVKNVLIPFRRTAGGSGLGPVSGALLANVSDEILKALQLEAWSIAGTVKLVNGTPKAIIISANETATDESASAGSASITGAYGDDESLMMSVDVENLNLFDVVRVNGSGSIEMTSDGATNVDVEASLAQPLIFTDGITLAEGSFTITNDSIEAEGKVEIDRDGITFDAEATIKLEADEQSIDLGGTIPSLSPVSGFTLEEIAVGGTLVHATDGFNGSLNLKSRNISFGGDTLVLKDPTLRVAFDCSGSPVELDDNSTEGETDAAEPTTTLVTETTVATESDTPTTTVVNGAVKPAGESVEKQTDENGCQVATAITSDLEINAGGTVIEGSLAGSVNTSEETASLAGVLDEVDFGSGIVLNGVEVKVAYEEGQPSAEINGSLSIFDTTVTASASLSSEKVVLEAGLESFKPFGEDGPGIAAGAVVAVVKLPAGEQLTWEPKAESLADYVPDDDLAEGDIRVLALAEMPASFAAVKSLTGDRLELPTNVSVYGAYNFSTGNAALTVGTVDGSVDVTGSFTREGEDAKWGYDISVAVPESIAIVSGLSLDSFNFRVTNLDDDDQPGAFRLAGDGALRIDLPSAEANISASITFNSAEDWTIAAEGTVPTFTPIPGFELTGLVFSGSINRNESGYEGALTLEAEDIAFAGGTVSLTNPRIDLGIACAADQAGAESNDSSRCELTLDASTGVSVDFGLGSVTGSLTGSIDTSAGTAALTAQLDEIEIADGLSMTSAELNLDVNNGALGLTASGAVSVFDTEIAGKIAMSKDEAIFQVSLADLAPFGESGPTITVGEVVVALGVSDEGSIWKPLDERLGGVVGETTLQASDVRLAVIVGMPSAFANVETLTKGAVALPDEMSITGSYNFSTGKADFLAAATSNTFSISGSLARESDDSPWAWNVDFSTNQEIAIIPSFDRLKLTNFGVNIGNVASNGTIGALQVTVTGAVSIEVNSSTTLSLGAEVTFQSSSQWRLAITGAIEGQEGGNWQLFPGVSLPAARATGTVEKNGDNFTVAIRLEQTSDWRPVTQVLVKDLFVEVSLAKSSGSWDFEFALGGKLTLTFGSVNIPELDITGGYAKGIWYLQVEVGDRVCRNVPVADSTGDSDIEVDADADVAPTTTVSAAVPSSADVTATTVAAAGQALRSTPPSTSGATTTSVVDTSTSQPNATSTSAVAPTTTTAIEQVATAETQEVCERVITITDGLEILDATFRIEYDTNSGSLAAKVSGGLRILGFVIDAEVRLSNRGIFMAAGVRNWELFDGGPVFGDLAVVFSTYETTYTLASGYEATVPGMDVTLIAQMATPEGLQKTIGDIQLEPLQISLVGLLTGNIDINIGILLPPDAWLFDTGSYGLRLASAGLQLKIRNFADITVGIYGEARLKVPGPPKLTNADGSPVESAESSDSITDKCKADIATVDTAADVKTSTMEVPFRIAIGLSSNGSINISASLGLDSKGNVNPWCNVFGIEGMNIYFAAFSFGINFMTTPIPTPEIGIALAFEFPTAIKELIGMEEGIKIEGFFFFSTTKGICFGVEVGDPPKVGQTSRDMKKALDLFDSNIIGNYVGFKFAPIGCTIAEKTYDPGISLGFAAQLFGISVVVYAKLDVKKLEITAYANIDPINIGPLRIDQTYLDLKISGSDPLDSHIIFVGGATLDMPAGPTRVVMKLAAMLGTSPSFAIDARVDNLVIVRGVLEVNRARIQGLVTISPLALFMNLEGDVNLLGQRVSGSFRLDVDSSGLREISASLKADINLAGVVRFNGSFAFSYLKGGFPSMDFAGKMIIGGRELANATGHLDQYFFSISAAVDLGILKGQIDGKVVFCNKDGSIKIPNRNNQQVTAAGGDYFFAASAGIDLGIVNANGSLQFGRAPDADVVKSQDCPTLTPTVTSQDADAVLDKYFQETMSTAPGYGCPTTTTSLTPTSTVAEQTATTVSCVVAPTTTTTAVIAPSTTAVIATTTTRAPGQSLRPRAASASTPTCLDSGAIAGLTGFQFANLACSAIEVPASGGTVNLIPSSASIIAARQDSAEKQYASAIAGYAGLNSYFRFDSMSSTPAGQTAIMGTGVSAQAAGRLGGARTFSATGENRVSFNGLRLNDQTNWTISAWIKPAEVNVNRWQAIVSGDTNAIGLHIKYGTNKLAITRIGVSDGTASTVGVTAGVWQHVALVKNGSTIAYYINGAAAGTTTIPAGNGANALTRSIGNGTTVNDPFRGDIDEVSIHTSALTASNLADLVARANTAAPTYTATVLAENGQPLVGASARVSSVLNDGTFEPGAVVVTLPSTTSYRRVIVAMNAGGVTSRIALAQAPSTPDAAVGPICLRLGGTTSLSREAGSCEVIGVAAASGASADVNFSPTVLGQGAAGGTVGTISISGVPAWLNVAVHNVGLGALPKGIKLTTTPMGTASGMLRSARVVVNHTSGATTTTLGTVVFVQSRGTSSAVTEPSSIRPTCVQGTTGADIDLGCSVVIPSDIDQRYTFGLSDAANQRVLTAISAGVDAFDVTSNSSWLATEQIDLARLFNQPMSVTFRALNPALTQNRATAITVSGTTSAAGNRQTFASASIAQQAQFTAAGSVQCSSTGEQWGLFLIDAVDLKPCGRAVTGSTAATFGVQVGTAIATALARGISAGSTVRVVADQPWLTASITPSISTRQGVTSSFSGTTPVLVIANTSAMPSDSFVRRATLKVQLIAANGTATDVAQFPIAQYGANRTGAEVASTCRSRTSGTNVPCASVTIDGAAGYLRMAFSDAEKSAMQQLISGSGSIEINSSEKWMRPTLAAYSNGVPGEMWVDIDSFVSVDALTRSASITVAHVSPTGVVTTPEIRTVRMSQNVDLSASGSGTCLNAAPNGAATVLVLRCGELRIANSELRAKFDVSSAGVTNAITNGLNPLFTATSGGGYTVTSDAEWLRATLANGAAGTPSGGLLVSADAMPNGIAQRFATVSLVFTASSGTRTTVASTTFSQSADAPTNTATLGCLRPTQAGAINIRVNCDNVVVVKAGTAGVATFDLDAELIASLRTQRAAGGTTAATSDAQWATIELYGWQTNGSGSAVPTRVAIRYAALAEGPDAYREAAVSIGGATLTFGQENLPRTTAGKAYAPTACNEAAANAPSTGNLGLLIAGDGGGEAACNTLQVAQQGGSSLFSLKNLATDAVPSGAYSTTVGSGSSAKYLGFAANTEAMTVRPVFNETNGQLAFVYTKLARLSSAARDRCTSVNLFDEPLAGGARSNKFTASFCQSKIGIVAARSERPQGLADAGQAAGTFNTFPNTWSTDGDTFRFTSQPTAQLIELKTNGVNPPSTPTEYRAVPATAGLSWAKAMVWNGLLANNVPNKVFVQVATLPFEETSRSAKFNVEGKVNGTWQRLATFYVSQVRESGTERYTQPDRPSKRITCLTPWNGASANPFTVFDQNWQNGIGDCKEVQVGYRVRSLRVYNSTWGTTPVYGLGWNDSSVGFTMLRANPAPQYGYVEWSTEGTSPMVRDKNNNATLKAVREVWARDGFPNKVVHKTYDINYDGWDGSSRYAYVTGWTNGPLGGNLKYRDLDMNMLLNVKYMGIDDVPEYRITPPPPVDGDPGPTGVTCVTGNSPIWYNDGSANQDKRCRIIEVGSDVTSLGLDVAADIRANVYADVEGTDDCIGPTKVSVETDNATAELTSSVEYRRNGVYSGLSSIGTGCSEKPSNGGLTVWSLKPVRPEEVSVTRVVLKHSVAIGFDRAKWFEGKASTLNAAETRAVFDANNSADEIDGEFYIVKYGSKAVEAENKAWEEAVAASGGSQYAVATPTIGASYAETAAAQASGDGLPTRITWGRVTLGASLNLGPLQGSFNFDGSFSLDGRVNLAMTGSLSVAPLAGATVSGSFKRTTTGDYTAKLAFSANVLNAATVDFKGEIVRAQGVTIYDFAGKGTLSLGSAVTGGGSFRLTNRPGLEGLRAEIKFAAGQKGLAYVAGSGSLAFSGSWWNGEFDGQLTSLIGSAQASIKVGNLRRKTGSCPSGSSSMNIAGVEYCQLSQASLSFWSTVTVFGQNFALSAEISNSGFSATAVTPSNYNGSNDTARLNTIFPMRTVFWLPFSTVRAGAYWGGSLSVQVGDPNRPAVAFSGTGRLIIDWYGDRGGTVSINGTFRPTKLCGKVWRVGFCV